jgi:uncharacterized membrane protein YphA (DoxX/SURF4 family)
MTFKSYLPWIVARIFVGGIFILAGFFKLIDPIENFRGMITAYGVIPYALVTPISLFLPWLEFLVGVFLIAGYFPRLSAAFLGLCSASFIILITVAKFMGTLPDSCGCFGEHIPMSPYQMLLLDALSFLLSVRLFQIKNHRLCLAGAD